MSSDRNPDSAPAAVGSDLRLPEGLVVGQPLPGGSGEVHRATWRGQPVVLRRAAGTSRAGAASELAALASVEHPGIARLVGFGAQDCGLWVAREWVAGQDLAAWGRGRSPEELGAVLARLCAALGHLHRRGLVHADLKPANVIVRPDGSPVVTDFGLARAVGGTEAGGVSGTLPYVAPEVLLGRPADARADLFALGVMLHGSTAAHAISIRELYARFPHEDFWSASGTRPDRLPTWARDLAVDLLEVDPARRPQSAGEVGRTLAARLGLEPPSADDAPAVDALRVPLRTGRESWSHAWWRGLREAGGAELHWIRVPEGEDPGAMADELQLVGALQGAAVSRLDVQHVLDGQEDREELAARASDAVRRARGEVLFVALERDAPWLEESAQALARAVLRSAAPNSESATLVLVARRAAPAGGPDWREVELPALTLEDVRLLLEERLESTDSERLGQFAQVLHAACAGGASTLEELLARSLREGWILAGDERPRLRPGSLPQHIEAGARTDAAALLAGTGRDARRVLAALEVAGGELDPSELEELTGLAERAWVGALGALTTGGSTVLTRRGDRRLVTLAPGVAAALRERVDEADQRELHGRRARRLAASGAPSCSVLPHAWRASPGDELEQQIVDESLRLRERGAAALALELHEKTARAARSWSGLPGPVLAGERALVWCALGQPERALAAIAPLRDAEDEPTVAIAERVRGAVAARRQEPVQALEHFERALLLDPAQRDEALLGKLRLLHERRQDDELCRWVEELKSAPGGLADLRARTRVNVEVIHALSRFRLGEVDRARKMLDESLGDARRQGDAAWEAGLCLNLGVLERQSGDLSRAITWLERAETLHDASGDLTGLGQARAMLGACLRQTGELARGEQVLRSALAIREQLGDRVGALGVRGMLGMLHADRGHARAAIEELERAAEGLRAAGRIGDSSLYATRADETRARIGQPAAEAGVASETDRAGEGDPRVLTSMARARWLRGDPGDARELAQRAAQLARSLGHVAFLAEAELLLARLEDRPPDAAPVAGDEPTPSPVAEDTLLLDLLDSGQAGFDLERAALLAERLSARGRHDRACRALLGASSRSDEPATADALAERAAQELERCTAGLSAEEADALRHALLGLPDPWPGDLTSRPRTTTEEPDEMEITSLLQINHRLLREEDLGSLLGTIVEHALELSGAERGFLMLEERGELRFDTALDSRRGGIEAPDMEVSQSVVREALEQMRPVRVSNAVEDPRLGHAPSVIELELRSILCVPFRIDEDVRGAVYLDHRLRQGAFDQRAERLASLLGDQAALAIVQVRRLEEIRRLNRELNRQVVAKDADLRTARRALRDAGLASPAGGLVGSSAAMRRVHHLIERAATTGLPALVIGASGTGKELAARALHELGPRAEGPFVSENCAALPATLIESELFGARRGAFTGADRDRPGLFERAHGGTLFLDEIGEMPLELQAKLLRVLETGEVRRLGDDHLRATDVRLVAATNRDLEREVAESRFRSDLFYRLAGLTVPMPSVAERPEDIPELVEYWLNQEQEQGTSARRISPETMEALCRRVWPGNVRELFHELARLCVMCDGDLDDPSLVRAPSTALSTMPVDASHPRTLAELEREAIVAALESSGGDKRRAAGLLGISRSKLYQRLKEWREGPEDDSDA